MKLVLSEVLFQEFLQGKLAAFHVVHVSNALFHNALAIHRTSAVEYLYNQHCVHAFPYTLQRIKDDLQQLLTSGVDEWLAAELRFALCANAALLQALVRSAVADADTDAATVLEFIFCPVLVIEEGESIVAQAVKISEHIDSDTMPAELVRSIRTIQADATHDVHDVDKEP